MNYSFKVNLQQGKIKAEKINQDINEIKNCLLRFGQDIIDVFMIDGEAKLFDNSNVRDIAALSMQLKGESPEYNSLKVIHLDSDENRKEFILLQYKESSDGYPCKISFNKAVYSCESLSELIHVLQEIAESADLYFIVNKHR
ncbi:MAG: hypothetical protein ACRC9Y_06295 [Aeromonas veronii]